MKKIISLVLILGLLAMACGCGSKEVDPNYQAYIDALMNQEQKPLVKLEAMPGQAITGLKSLTVYAAPSQGALVQQKQPEPAHPAWGILGGLGKAAISMAGWYGIMTGVTGGMADLAESLAGSGGTTNNFTLSGDGSSGVIGGGSSGAYTSPPTVVTQPDPVIVTVE